MKSLTEHPNWAPSGTRQGIALRIKVDNIINGETAERRLELQVGDLDANTIKNLQIILIDCAHCGRPCQLFRRHDAFGGRLEAKVSTLTVATCCPTEVRPGCCRGKKSSAAINRILVAIWMVRQANPTLEMARWKGSPPAYLLPKVDDPEPPSDPLDALNGAAE